MDPKLQARYDAAMHGVLSAIALDITRTFEQVRDGSLMRVDCDHPLGKYLKMMRVGLDGTLASQGGLTDLLIKKGVFTLDEYQLAMTVAAESELVLQTERMRERYPDLGDVTFG